MALACYFVLSIGYSSSVEFEVLWSNFLVAQSSETVDNSEGAASAGSSSLEELRQAAGGSSSAFMSSASQQQNPRGGSGKDTTETALVDYDADEMVNRGDGITRLVGNVTFHHNGAIIQCDSAFMHPDDRMEFFDNVVIEKDSALVYGDKVDYNQNTNLADVIAPIVKMMRGDAIMYSYNLQFNTETSVGVFHSGGVLVQQTNEMEAQRGWFNANENYVTFYEEVDMRNDDYLIKTDSLGFSIDDQRLDFLTKTDIWSDGDNFLQADSGNYFSATKSYLFTSNAYVLTADNEIWADTMRYYTENRQSYMFSNVQILDTANATLAFSDWAFYDDSVQRAVLADLPSIRVWSNADTSYMKADTILMVTLFPEDEILEGEEDFTAGSVAQSEDNASTVRPQDTVPAPRGDRGRDSLSKPTMVVYDTTITESVVVDTLVRDTLMGETLIADTTFSERIIFDTLIQERIIEDTTFVPQPNDSLADRRPRQMPGDSTTMNDDRRPQDSLDMQQHRSDAEVRGDEQRDEQRGQGERGSQGRGGEGRRGGDGRGGASERGQRPPQEGQQIAENSETRRDVKDLPTAERDIEQIAEGVALSADTLVRDSVGMGGYALDSIALDSLALDSLALDSLTLDSLALGDFVIDSLMLDSVAMAALSEDKLLSQVFSLDSLALASYGLDSVKIDSLGLGALRFDSLSIGGVDSLALETLEELGLDSLALDSLAKGAYILEFREGEDYLKPYLADSTLRGFMQDSLAVDSLAMDSLAMAADSVFVEPAPERLVMAYNNVWSWSRDYQMKCDSVVGYSVDSLTHLFGEPVIWAQNNQITSEEVMVYTKNEELDWADFIGSPVLSQQVIAGDTLLFNQAIGKVLEMYFTDNEIDYAYMSGNVQNIYYMQEETDITAMVAIDCSDLTMYFENREPVKMNWKGKGSGPIYPMNQIPVTQPRFLTGYTWQSDIRPRSKWSICRRVARASVRSEVEKLEKPVFDITKEMNATKERLLKAGKWTDRVDVPDVAPEYFVERNKQLFF
ncbi:MAG: OstA-like protein [Rikenellaceae bacterium]